MSAIEKNGSEVKVIPDQDILSSNRDELRNELAELVSEGVQHIIVDMSKVGRIDSSGLSVFIATYNSLKANEGVLELINVNETIRKLFLLTRFDRYISISE